MIQALTQQQIFDQVADHLLTQKKKSYNKKETSCAYRGPNGLKCAIGGILADNEIVKIANCISPNDVNYLAIHQLKLPDRLTGHTEFLRYLQMIHDVHKPSRWIEKLSAFAKEKGLDKSVLDKYRKNKKPVAEQPLTEQKIFDKVATHLLTQKKKSLMPEELSGFCKCAYRGKDGLSCAVGCLITDQEAAKIGEDKPVGSVTLVATRLEGFEDFLGQLQLIHDNCKPSKWINKLSLLATARNLNKDVLKRFRK